VGYAPVFVDLHGLFLIDSGKLPWVA
jgi:hypothetical protein